MTTAEVEQLRTARANYVRQLVDLSDPLRRKISYSIAGRSLTWTEYRKMLREEIQSLDEMIRDAGGDDDRPAGGYIATAAG